MKSEPNNLEWLDKLTDSLIDEFANKDEDGNYWGHDTNLGSKDGEKTRFKLAITAKISEMQHLHEYAGNVDYCFICGLTPEQLIENTVELSKRKDEAIGITNKDKV